MSEIQIQSADYIVPATVINFPASITAGATAYSSVIKTQGYHAISVSVLSSQNGTLSIQRMLDVAGTMPQGAAVSVAVAGGTQATVNLPSDGTPFEYAQISISNSSGSTATLKNTLVVLSTVSGGVPNISLASALPTGSNNIGSVSAAANTSGGASTFFASAQLATVTSVKSSAGNLYGFTLQNPNASSAYVQFFDLATGSVTLGSTTPKLSYWVPANGSYDFPCTSEAKISFATAISIAATTTATGSTAPATGLLINLLYK